MVTCARCDRVVDTVRTVTPDAVTKDVLESIDHGEEDFSGPEGSMDVCAQCMDELTGE